MPGALVFVPSPSFTQERLSSACKDAILVLPAVSVGNVAQLAVDLMLATFSCERMGWLLDDALLPAAANDTHSVDASPKGALSTGCEVFACPERKLVLIQQRAPTVAGRRHEFARRLADWALSLNVRRILLLTSAHAHTRTDAQLSSALPQLACFCLGLGACSVATGLSLPSLGTRPKHGCAAEAADQSDSLASLSPQLESKQGQEEVVAVQGGGITGPFFRYLEAHSSDAEVLGLVWYAAEGDNAADGAQLARVAERVLARWTGTGGEPAKWRQPAAWDALARARAPEEEQLYE